MSDGEARRRLIEEVHGLTLPIEAALKVSRVCHALDEAGRRIEALEGENERLKMRVNRMLTAGMGQDWGDGFKDEDGPEALAAHREGEQ